MKITNFSIAPRMLVPGEDVTLSFTIKRESGDTVGENGLYVWATQPNGSEATMYKDDTFTIAKGESKTITAKFPLLSGRSYSRGAVISVFGVQLGLFGERVDTSYAITMLDAWYRPEITVFRLERATGGVLNDEGESLIADITADMSGSAVIGNMTARLYYREGSEATTSSSSIALTSKIPDMLVGIVDSTTITGRTYSNTSDWHFLLYFGDAYENVQVRYMVSRAFANMHLSGAVNGGVCFGGFSKSTASRPMLESHYPIHAYRAIYAHGGIDGVTNYMTGEQATGGTWIDGKPIYRYMLVASTTADGGEETIGALPAAIDEIIYTNGTMKTLSSGNFRAIPFAYHGSTGWSACYYVQADGTVIAQIGSNYSGEHRLILEFLYTKTTD